MRKLIPLMVLILFAFSISMISADHSPDGYYSRVTWNASEITVPIGTVINPITLFNVSFVDGISMRTYEVGGSPAFDIRVNFSGIPNNVLNLGLYIYDQYEGNPAHVVNTEVWNFMDKDWTLIEIIPEHAFQWTNSSLSVDDQTFIQNGEVWVRFNHVSNGVVTHYLNIDYIRLQGYVLSDPILTPWDINWFSALIWLALLAIGVSKPSKIIIMFAGFFGLILGVILLGVSSMTSIAVILFNFYLLYEGNRL